MVGRFFAILGLALISLVPAAWADTRSAQYEAMVMAHASANGIPPTLVHRVIMRESRYNPRLIGKGGTIGLMQIKHATARGMGYRGTASGLLDPETNLTYAVRYLAGAYRLANGNESRAVSYYARGYYYAAKARGLQMQALAQPMGVGASQPVFSLLGAPITTTGRAPIDTEEEENRED